MSTSTCQSNFFRYRWVTCAALCCLVTFSQTASAQYKSLPPTATGPAERQLRNKAQAAFRDAANHQANKGAVDDYFRQVYFPGMTNYSDKALGGLAKKRDGLMRIIRGSKVPAAQKQLTEIAFNASQGISRGNYHPSVRYNVVLILGALDERLAMKNAPPVPLPNATRSLIELLENDNFNDVKVPTSIKLGALVGLERHAHCGMPEEFANQLTQATLKIIAQEEPAADVTLEVHHWMQCQAARVLTRLYAKKPTPEVQVALTKMINDGNLSFEDRCSVVALLYRMDYKNAEGVDIAATATAVQNLLKQVVSKEAQLARDFEGSKLSRGSRRNVVTIYQRNRLASRLWSIGRGGSALKAGLPDDGQATIGKLVKSLGGVLVIIGDKDSIDLDITEAVQNLEKEINAILAAG
jgi:hypothetical protein